MFLTLLKKIPSLHTKLTYGTPMNNVLKLVFHWNPPLWEMCILGEVTPWDFSIHCVCVTDLCHHHLGHEDANVTFMLFISQKKARSHTTRKWKQIKDIQLPDQLRTISPIRPVKCSGIPVLVLSALHNKTWEVEWRCSGTEQIQFLSSVKCFMPEEDDWFPPLVCHSCKEDNRNIANNYVLLMYCLTSFHQKKLLLKSTKTVLATIWSASCSHQVLMTFLQLTTQTTVSSRKQATKEPMNSFWSGSLHFSVSTAKQPNKQLESDIYNVILPPSIYSVFCTQRLFKCSDYTHHLCEFCYLNTGEWHSTPISC